MTNKIQAAWKELHKVLRGLRARNHPDSLIMTNALEDIREKVFGSDSTKEQK